MADGVSRGRVRVGIVGCGGIATHAHIPAYRGIPEVDIVPGVHGLDLVIDSSFLRHA